MGKNTNTTASESDAVVEKVETQVSEEVATETTIEEVVYEATAEEVVSEGLLEVKFLLTPTRKFKLAYTKGETGFLPEKQANEVVKAKYAEFVK